MFNGVESPGPVHIFCDFDGTMTLQDTGALLIDSPKGIGREKRLELEEAVLKGQKSYRDAIKEMWSAVTLNWDQSLQILKDVQLDPKFLEFAQFCREHALPLTIVSSGPEKLVHWYLQQKAGEEIANLELFCNQGEPGEDHWLFTFRDNSEYGNDKGNILRQEKQKKSGLTAVFVGDGLSDLSAVNHADVLLARNEKMLAKWCDEHSIPFIGFDSFETVLATVKELLNPSVHSFEIDLKD